LRKRAARYGFAGTRHWFTSGNDFLVRLFAWRAWSRAVLESRSRREQHAHKLVMGQLDWILLEWRAASIRRLKLRRLGEHAADFVFRIRHQASARQCLAAWMRSSALWKRSDKVSTACVKSKLFASDVTVHFPDISRYFSMWLCALARSMHSEGQHALRRGCRIRERCIHCMSVAQIRPSMRACLFRWFWFSFHSRNHETKNRERSLLQSTKTKGRLAIQGVRTLGAWRLQTMRAHCKEVETRQRLVYNHLIKISACS